jgi:hypothetical protein
VGYTGFSPFLRTKGEERNTGFSPFLRTTGEESNTGFSPFLRTTTSHDQERNKAITITTFLTFCPSEKPITIIT